MTAPLTAEVLVGDCRELMRAMPADSVQVCVTSAPYWGQLDYRVIDRRRSLYRITEG